MSETLYLDTARLGLMSPSAQRLQTAFARYAGDPHGLLYFGEFLRLGSSGLPSGLTSQVSDLSAWRGIDDLADSIRRLTRAREGADVHFASRSTSLMKLAANRLVASCQRVLTTDSLWSPYRRLLVRTSRRSGRAIFVASLRDAALNNEEPSDALAEIVCDASVQYRCDGLVLPLLDHRGVSLPINQIVGGLTRLGRRPRYVVVDASQALGHIPINFESLACDLLIAGAHKWLGGYQPLGIGLSRASAEHSFRDSFVNDPLFRLTQEAAGLATVRHGETAAVLPLLTAAGALADLENYSVDQRLQIRQANRQRLAAVLNAAQWRVIRRRAENHGVLVARPTGRRPRLSSRARRLLLFDYGVVATTYASGLVRFSLPCKPLSESDLMLLSTAMRAEGRPAHPQGVTHAVHQDDGIAELIRGGSHA